MVARVFGLHHAAGMGQTIAEILFTASISTFALGVTLAIGTAVARTLIGAVRSRPRDALGSGARPAHVLTVPPS